MALSMGKPDRPDSEQPPLHTVQEPVLVLTTSHLIILAQQGQQPAAVLPTLQAWFWQCVSAS